MAVITNHSKVVENFRVLVEITIPGHEVVDIVNQHWTDTEFSKINAIKDVKARYGTGLRESKIMVEQIMDQLGIQHSTRL